MRHLILEEWLSLDGFATDQKGTTDFFPSTDESKSFDMRQLEFLETVDTMLMGRTTYELFSDYWPQASDTEIIGAKLNSLQKIVFSRSLERAPWPGFPDARIVSTDLIENVRALKQQDGKNIIMWGSLSVAKPLIEANLIDQYRIHICPTATGGGKKLFPELADYKKFQLSGSDSFSSGVVSMYYEPKSDDGQPNRFPV